MRFEVRSIDEYVAISADTAGPMALVLQALTPAERAQFAGSLGDALDPFRTEAGYEVPGLAIVAVATC